VRIAVGLEYLGTAYAGWQRQLVLPSVQAEVERALSLVADHPVVTACAGRTDTGVHATGQVIHFDTPSVRSERGWVLGANRYLPPDISINWARAVADGFHARYAAMNRSYRYLILNAPVRSALWAGRACLRHAPLDAERMHQSLQCLVGRHDFSSFRAAECQSVSTVRRLDAIRVARHPLFLSHTGCRAVADLPRNKTDTELRGVADSGGLVGIYFMPFLAIGRQPTADDLIAHIEHAWHVCGEEHVGIGTDGVVPAIDDMTAYRESLRAEVAARRAAGVSATGERDDIVPFLPDLAGPQKFAQLYRLLQRRGHSARRLDYLFQGNFVRLAKATWRD